VRCCTRNRKTEYSTVAREIGLLDKFVIMDFFKHVHNSLTTRGYRQQNDAPPQRAGQNLGVDIADRACRRITTA
jgi:hypothetical protein